MSLPTLLPLCTSYIALHATVGEKVKLLRRRILRLERSDTKDTHALQKVDEQFMQHWQTLKWKFVLKYNINKVN